MSKERVPPHSQEAEEAVLGTLMLSPSGLPNLVPILEPKHFYRADHQKLYAVMLQLYNGDDFEPNQTADIVLVQERLRANGDTDIAGNTDLFMKLTASVPSLSNAKHYARIIRELYGLRQLIAGCTDVVKMAYDGNSAALELAPARMMSVANESAIEESVDAAEVLVKIVEQAEKGENVGEAQATGIGKLDVITNGGLRAGDFVIVGGRPSSGKSALVKNLFAKGIEFGRRIAVFSLEDSRELFLSNVLAHVAGADTQEWQNKNPGEWENVLAAAERLSGYGNGSLRHCLLDDSHNCSPTTLHAKLEQYAAQGPVDMVIVDYLQLMSPDPGMERATTIARVEKATRSLKLLARRFNTRVIALSQLSRECMKQDRAPRLDDLRDCGSIEQDADIVMLMHDNPADYKGDRVFIPGKSEVANPYRHDIIVAKQRCGPTAHLRMNFMKHTLTFESFPVDGEPEAPVVVQARKPVTVPDDGDDDWEADPAW